MSRVLEKVERRLGEKLLLKGERCAGPKCAVVRRGYPPGIHGKTRKRKRASSEYGVLLREKQKVRFLYGLDDKDVRRYTQEAAARPESFRTNFLKLLERRLDNVVFRLGLAESRRMARFLVNHGHITLNGRKVNIPSSRVKKGDVVAIKERSVSSVLFAYLDDRLKKYEPPLWLSLEKNKKTGKVTRLPDEAGDFQENIDLSKIKEFYLR